MVKNLRHSYSLPRVPCKNATDNLLALWQREKNYKSQYESKEKNRKFLWRETRKNLIQNARVNARDDWTRAWVARLDCDNVEACAREYSAALLKLPQPAINSFYIYVISLPCEHVFLGGNISLPFVCTISEFKLLSLKGNRPHTMANKITPLWKKKIFEIN